MNEGTCRVVQRHLSFNGGMAYGIDCLLTPPSLGGRCDTQATFDFPVSLTLVDPRTTDGAAAPSDPCLLPASSSLLDGVCHVLLLCDSLSPRLQTEGAI